MTNEILVGIDGSDDSLAALRWAARFADLTRRPLALAHAWQHGRRLEGAFATVHADAASLEAGVIDTLRDLAVKHGVDPDTPCRALRGPTADSLLRDASRTGAGMIVVGASGAGRARRALLGSVSRELISCPSHVVAVVPHEETESAPTALRFVVGVDGSDGASRALRWAADAAQAAGGEVVAVHAFECPVPDASREEMASLASERRQRFDEEWCAPLRTAAVVHRAAFEIGDARRALRRVVEAEQPMCVVAGSRGLGALSQRRLGSLTHDLVRELPCPTVIVPSVRDRILWPTVHQSNHVEVDR
jgi:nucleotide-binding universal stress UspA family protein